jgi:nucleotide-binding universal stress UspA family protein
MMKKVVIAMPLDEKLQSKILEDIQKVDWLNDQCELDFVHIFKQENYPYMMPPTIYPNKEQKGEITKTITEIFQGLTKDLKFKEKRYHVDYNESPKEGMVEYLKNNNSDVVISLTREKHGVTDYFSSTFTEYLIKHAPCNVLVLRHK